jgi:hypothetical protein
MNPRSRRNSALKRARTAVLAELPAPKEAQSRTQLGVRIAEATHRQLKLAAVIRGVAVQTLVEQAVMEFLSNHPELLENALARQRPAKAIARTTR